MTLSVPFGPQAAGRMFRLALFPLASAMLAACGGGGGDDPPPPAPQYSVGGALTGLAGAGLVLQNNGSGDLAVSANGSFAFSSALAASAAYQVSVKQQPTSPAQTCAITNASGTVGSANVTSVAVTCVTNSYSVGGTTAGLAGVGLALRVNDGPVLVVPNNGVPFAFAPLASGTTFAVTVVAQPVSPSQTCVLANGSGVVGAADVSNIAVTCTTNAFTVSGTVSGLSGSGLSLQLNGAGDIPVADNGTFIFASPLASGAPYSVAVASQPASPSQTCVVPNGTGSVGNSAVSNVTVTCSTNTYTVGGTITRLSGTGLELRVNGGPPVAVANGASPYALALLPSGSSYTVTVATQPVNPTQTCVVANPAGTLVDVNVTNANVTCTTHKYAVGGIASGLIGSGLELQINGGDDLAVAANGAFSFATDIENGTNYAVTVKTQPSAPAQTCVLKPAQGTMPNSAVANVILTCTAQPARFAYVGSQTGIYCFAIDAISGALQGLDNNHCDTGVITGVATDPTGNFVFATHSTLDTLVSYRINQSTGALTRVAGPMPSVGSNPIAVTVDPSGRFVYVASYGSNHVLGFAFDPTTGVLTAVPGTACSTLAQPIAVVVEPAGRFLYTASDSSGSVAVCAIDAATGEVAHVAGSPFVFGTTAYSIALDPAGEFAMVPNGNSNTVSVLSLDAVTGVPATVAGSPFATGSFATSAAVDPSGSWLYVTNRDSDSISAYSIAAGTGSLTPIAGSPFSRPGSPYGVIAHPSGDVLYVSNNGTGTIATYVIDAATGALTEMGSPVAAAGNSAAGTYGIAISR